MLHFEANNVLLHFVDYNKSKFRLKRWCIMFSEKLKSLRNMANLTQGQLAKRLSISRSSLSLYEIGMRQPDLSTIRKICKYFDVSADYLINDDTHIPANALTLSEQELCLVNAFRNKDENNYYGNPLDYYLEYLGIDLNEESKKDLERYIEFLSSKPENHTSKNSAHIRDKKNKPIKRIPYAAEGGDCVDTEKDEHIQSALQQLDIKAEEANMPK